MEPLYVRAVAACLGLVATALTHAAAAQDVGAAMEEAGEAGSVFGANRASRPLVMPQGNVRAGLTVNVLRDPDFLGRGAVLAIGGGVSPIENLEVGFESRREGSSPFASGGLLGIVIEPISGIADVPFYARYQFLNTDRVQIAAELDVTFPVDLNLDIASVYVFCGWGVGATVPIRVHPHARVAIDTGVQATLYTGYGDPYEVVRVPLLVRGALGDMGYVGGGTQFTWSAGFEASVLDLGLEGGVSMGVGSGMLDVEASFGFPALVAFDGGQSVTFTEIWMTSLNARYHFDAF